MMRASTSASATTTSLRATGGRHVVWVYWGGHLPFGKLIFAAAVASRDEFCGKKGNAVKRLSDKARLRMVHSNGTAPLLEVRGSASVLSASRSTATSTLVVKGIKRHILAGSSAFQSQRWKNKSEDDVLATTGFCPPFSCSLHL